MYFLISLAALGNKTDPFREAGLRLLWEVNADQAPEEASIMEIPIMLIRSM